LNACLLRHIPGFDSRILHADYPGNDEIWMGICGHTRELAGFNPESSPYAHNTLSVGGPGSHGLRAVSVEEMARIGVTLFCFTLLIAHGVFAPAIDLKQWESLTGTSRRRAWRFLWDQLHQALSIRDDTHAAPTRRAAYEIASLLVPGVARTYEKDREAMKRFEHQQRWRSSR
jgi:hypothetical protein